VDKRTIVYNMVQKFPNVKLFQGLVEIKQIISIGKQWESCDQKEMAILFWPAKVINYDTYYMIKHNREMF